MESLGIDRSFAPLLPFGPDVHLLETDQHHPSHFSSPFIVLIFLSFLGTCESDAPCQGQRAVVIKNKK